MNGTPNLSAAVWRKSSYSNGGDANCVEVAGGLTGIVPVRDSKNPEGPALALSDTAWNVFIEELRRGTS
ncbi:MULTISPECIES: DUF397 domain-containing protein [unclassified Streptomyces]|uniref:DUF397 domain-containing protein n=1 Tax=unclassified Streptomyces TaxID=2593676 RepID=UPI0033E152BC